MVQVLGFDHAEEWSIRQLLDRFRAGHFRLGDLRQIEKADLPGYEGKVMPRLGHGGRVETTMYLSSCNAFTIAHELAHVSDIAVRRQDSVDNLGCGMPSQWHLAYKMSSEYYANRIACRHSDGEDCFRAFKSDAAGLLDAAKRHDWGSFMVYFALCLGVLHGIDRMDLDPLAMVAPQGLAKLPERVQAGMAGFAEQSVGFFDGYADLAPSALAA